jgi:DNA adenine methylase
MELNHIHEIPLLPAWTLTRVTQAPEEITSPLVQYTGSKWRLAPWIISQFPVHTCYVEPFCGGAAILFRKQPSYLEVINDLNQEVVNFFDVLRDKTDELLRAIDLTPWSRYELSRAMTPSCDPIERARRFYIRAYQSYTAGEAEKSRGWATAVNESRRLRRWPILDHLYAGAKRLKLAQIENDTALNVINRFDDIDTLFYCDPPYVADTRTSIDYPLEMTDADHTALSEVLHSIKGMALISGYDSELYQHLYADWKMVSTESRTVNNVRRMECLWISPKAQAALEPKPIQPKTIPMFA